MLPKSLTRHTLAAVIWFGSALMPLGAHGLAQVSILYPRNEAVFPCDMAAPLLRWEDANAAVWTVRMETAGSDETVTAETAQPEWMPSENQWATVRQRALEKDAIITVQGRKAATDLQPISEGRVAIRISKDPVDASIFYREVPLPVQEAMFRKEKVRWRVGDIARREPPRTVLSDMKTCANCHSFSRDGHTLAMDVDYGDDKSAYAIMAVGEKAVLGTAQFISWNDYKREEKEKTFGVLSQISPDGRYIISTVKEFTAYNFYPKDYFYGQLFCPIRGILAVYDRTNHKFFALPGADNRNFVQTNPVWSPDGQEILFARIAAAPDDQKELTRLVKAYTQRTESLQFSLYRMPFNEGKGGAPQPIPGAAENGKSNYFPRISPDGKWLAFCQANSFMLNQPDSAIFIMQAKGGAPRALRGNTPGRMNSWHSWSPNSRWLLFSSKANGPYTQIWLSHVDENGFDSVPVVLDWFTEPDRAANLPEFVPLGPGELMSIERVFAE